MRTFVLYLLIAIATVVYGRKRDVHILAVNDMHSAIEQMPQLIGVADSLRALYPSLLVFSSGDNHTGNPINDKYQPSGYPMIELMNMAGFNASAIGNHEFDAFALPQHCYLSAFPYLCANMTADDSTGITVRPYQFYDVEGLKVGVFSVVQTNQYGIPDTHPDLLHGVHFESPIGVIPRYQWMADSCDVTIMLSHMGYHPDLWTADHYPWIDAILGGHTHRQLDEKEPLRNGVLITQNRQRLGRAVHVTLTVDSGRVVSKCAEYIHLHNFHSPNKVARALVKRFQDNPYFKRVLTHAKKPFSTRNEIGMMVCDALMEETHADIAIMNYRGIRVTELHGGDITLFDAYEIDPYGSNVATMTMTGAQLEKFINEYCRRNIYKFPHLGGLHADITLKRKDDNEISSVRITTLDGKPLDKYKSYKIVTNSYVLGTSRHLPCYPQMLNTKTSDVIIRFLEQHESINYEGKGNLNYIFPEK